MAARSFGSADPDVPGVRQLACLAGPSDPLRHSLKPRLAVMAPCISEAVRSAGGWLFDQVMAGWDVTVLTADDADARPLQILGVRATDLEGVLARRVRGSCLQGIAVRTDLYGSDSRIRRMVSEALEGGVAEVRLWGGCPAELDDAASPEWHGPSFAARAFKVQARAVPAVPAEGSEGSEDTEEFRSTTRRPGLVLV